MADLPIKVGDDIGVWWSTERPKVGSWNPARVLAIEPYRGRFTHLFTHTLTLQCPEARKGTCEMAVNIWDEKPLTPP
jgi:hypothetical protein